MKRTILWGTLPFLFSACGDKAPELPETPQEMYEYAQKLLQPSAEMPESDFAGALEWTRKAAEQGWLQAQLDMAGLYYAGGRGVQKDFKEAYYWFEQAAKQGNSSAEVFLGVMLYAGEGVQKDVQKAMEHWRIAAAHGVAEAQYRLGRLLAQQPESVQEGVAFLEKAAREIPQAATALGNIFYKGVQGILSQDADKAAQWYEKGAMAGDPFAQLVLAEMLFVGEPIPRDEPRALAMLRMAAGQDYPAAMARLVNVLRNAPNAAEYEQEAAAWEERLQEVLKQKQAK